MGWWLQGVLAQLEPDNPFYNIPVGLKISGELDMERLQHSVIALLDRHEGLRTIVETVEGQPKVSFMAVPESFEIPVMDLSDYSEIEQEERVEALVEDQLLAIAQQDAQTPFAPNLAPLHPGSTPGPTLHRNPSQPKTSRRAIEWRPSFRSC